MMCCVIDTNSSDGFANAQQNEHGVLGNLPRTRPQRASRRRVAARNAGRAGAETAPSNGADRPGLPQRPAESTADLAAGRPAAARASTGKRAPSASSRPGGSARGRTSAQRPTSVSRRARGSKQDAAPRQGFECDADAASGPVQPPGAAELVASVAEIVGELTKAGFSTGERLLKDVISRLPLS